MDFYEYLEQQPDALYVIGEQQLDEDMQLTISGDLGGGSTQTLLLEPEKMTGWIGPGKYEVRASHGHGVYLHPVGDGHLEPIGSRFSRGGLCGS